MARELTLPDTCLPLFPRAEVDATGRIVRMMWDRVSNLPERRRNLTSRLCYRMKSHVRRAYAAKILALSPILPWALCVRHITIAASGY